MLAMAFTMAIISFVSALDVTATKDESASSFQTLPEVEFSAQSYSVTEGSSRTINVNIFPAPTVTATVDYLTLDGSAVAGVDYVATTGELEFVPGGSTTQSFSVQTIANSSTDGDRTVNLILRNPVEATLGSQFLAELIIEDDDPTPTATTDAEATPIFVDVYEPNNSIDAAFGTSAGATPLCDATLWPVGDIDYYRFIGKDDSAYEVLTTDLSAGLDTVMTVFDTEGDEIETNDDYQFGNRGSQVLFTAKKDGYYFARVINQSGSDPADQTYCFEVSEIAGTATPTPFPTTTPVPGVDDCEYNGDFDQSCLIGVNSPLDNMSFVPIWDEGPDNDFYRLWMKEGIYYTCRTFNLSSVNDTNMIIYDQNFNGITGNDDRAPGDLSSEVSYQSTYTGWLYILVGPVAPPEFSVSYLYTYSIECVDAVLTPTPSPVPTRPPSSGGGVPSPPTPTPILSPTLGPTPTTFAPVTQQPTPRPVVVVVPLPTVTPAAEVEQTINLDLTVYYDSNLNFTPEITEGVEDVSVAIYDNGTNELLAFGYTNEAGSIRFGSLVVSGEVRISIPFLQFNQVVTSDSTVFIRIAPFLLPEETS
jgi:hypothetical protein